MFGVLVGNLIFELTPGHAIQPLDPAQIILPAVVALVGFFAGGAVWGLAMGRLAQAMNRRRMMLAGALGFAPIALATGLGLQVIEPIALERFGAILPLHRLFTVLFVPTAFLIAGLSAWAIGIGLREPALAKILLWRVGLGAAITFLLINLVMEGAGWVVGAPRAEERFTMLTVMFLGNVGAAIVGGGVMALTIVSGEATERVKRKNSVMEQGY
jgi:hypothetical protein